MRLFLISLLWVSTSAMAACPQLLDRNMQTLDERAFERFQNHAGGEKFLRQRIAPQQVIVGEDQSPGDVIEA